MKINPVREKILSFLKKHKGDISDMSLREVGYKVGLGEKDQVNPQVIAHNLAYLEYKGYIRRRTPSKRIYDILEDPVSDIVYIKLYSTTAECGPSGVLGDDNIKEEIPLHSKTFGISNPEDYFLIRAKGESMKPMIYPNDLVLARIQNSVDAGQIAVIVHNDMPKIKRISGGSKGKYSLISLNTEYSDEDIYDTSARVVGLVKSIIRHH